MTSARGHVGRPSPSPAALALALEPRCLAQCCQLATADVGTRVTIVVMEECPALPAVAGVAGALPNRVRLATIPKVLPSERNRCANFAGFVEAVKTRMVETVERLLGSLERKPDAILANTFLTWGIPAGAARGILVCSLWTQPATFFLAL